MIAAVIQGYVDQSKEENYKLKSSDLENFQLVWEQ
jgi:hypothetical protein